MVMKNFFKPTKGKIILTILMFVLVYLYRESFGLIFFVGLLNIPLDYLPIHSEIIRYIVAIIYFYVVSSLFVGFYQFVLKDKYGSGVGSTNNTDWGQNKKAKIVIAMGAIINLIVNILIIIKRNSNPYPYQGGEGMLGITISDNDFYILIISFIIVLQGYLVYRLHPFAKHNKLYFLGVVVILINILIPIGFKFFG